MRALALALLVACTSADSISPDNDGRSTAAAFNAFALGYFSGLTVGISDVALGGLMNRGQAEQARADRRTNDGLDWLGKALGFGTLIVVGWRIYARRRREE